MRALCCLCDGARDHRTIQGSARVPGITKRVSLSSYAGGYTRQFANSMVAAFEADLPAHVAPRPWKKQELMHENYPADTFADKRRLLDQ